VPAELAAEFKAATSKQVPDVPGRKAITPYAHAEMRALSRCISMRRSACSFVAELAQHDLVAFRRGAAIDPWMIQIPPKRFAVIRCGNACCAISASSRGSLEAAGNMLDGSQFVNAIVALMRHRQLTPECSRRAA
jgi:hypothetical protein